MSMEDQGSSGVGKTGWESELLTRVLRLPEDPQNALRDLLRYAAELAGAQTAVFQRVVGELVVTETSWGAPSGLEPVDLAPGHLCVYVLRQAKDQLLLVKWKELAPFMASDPLLRSGDYLLCLAQPVKGTDGVLLLLYREGFPPGNREREALGMLALAVSKEWRRKRREERARDIEDKFSALINTAHEGFVIADETGKIAFWNRGAQEIFGYSREEAMGQSVLSLVPEGRREACRRELLSGKETGEIDLVGKVVEAEGRRSDGTRFPMEVSVTSWLTGRGKYYGIVIRDITWRKSMEEDLRRSLQELDEFADTVAHDLRSPLTLMAGYAQTAKSSLEEGDMETLRACLEGMERASRRGLDYLDSLLSFARAERSMPALKSVDPREVVSEVLEELGTRIRSSGAAVRVIEPMPMVRADPVHLHQILVNLLDNALKHGKKEKEVLEVEVGAEAHVGEATFYVRDNGPGIPEKLREEIFLPFRRFSESGEPGLGIGLSTARRLVELAGGKIWVEPNPAGGSVFRFTIPLASPSPAPFRDYVKKAGETSR